MKNKYIEWEYYPVQYSGYHTVDGRIPAPPGMYKTHVNNEIDYQPQLVQDFFHQQ